MKLTALVIEDNKDNMELITIILEKNGIRTLCAENGKTGIEMALEEKPDFILLDIQLPDMDGIEVLEKLRKLGPTEDIPVVALTTRPALGSHPSPERGRRWLSWSRRHYEDLCASSSISTEGGRRRMLR